MKRYLVAAAGLTAFAAPSLANAQLWNPLMMVPRPNVIIAHDTSVTMGIDDSCNNCHIPGSDRLATSKADILATLPVFSNYFTYGGFRYAGCDYAKIVPPLVMPTPGMPSMSLGAVTANINSAQACGSSERRYPGGNQGSCARPNCNDSNVVWALAYGGMAGFDPIGPFRHQVCGMTYAGEFNYCTWPAWGPGGLPPAPTPPSPACDADGPASITDYALNGACIPSIGFRGGCYHVIPWCIDGSGQYDWTWILQDIQNIQWPRWDPTGLTPARVRAELCDVIRPILQRLKDELYACRPDAYGPAGLMPDLGDISGDGWCDPNVIAASACQPGSPLFSTCVCNQSNPQCVQGGNRVSDCGNALDWKARQQVAVCQAHDSAAGAFVDFFRNQPDNVMAGGCRENAALFFTDGYMGQTTGVAVEATAARSKGVYDSAGGYQNMAVFRVANAFAGDADRMMQSVSNGLVPNAYRATDRVTMQVAFAKLLNRTYQGVYTGTSLSQDNFGSRAVFHSFHVPQYRNVGGAENTSFVDSYLGWPAKLSVHSIDVNGNVSAAPLYETDDTARIGRNGGCYSNIGDTATGNALTLGGSFRNGRARRLDLGNNGMDRNGDGSLDNAGHGVTVGGMFSIAATKPVVLEASREELKNGDGAATFITHINNTRSRPRVFFSWGNGVLHGFHGGNLTVRKTTAYAGQTSEFDYDDAIPEAGAEVLRYTPSWVNAGWPANSYDFAMNDMVQQPLTTGHLATREVLLSGGWATVVVGAQGGSGSGMFSLDVTDPCSARVLAEWNLPGQERASAEPMIYLMSMTANPRRRAVVITTSGMDSAGLTLKAAPSRGTIYAYDIETGTLIHQIALPGGVEYPSAPVCADLRGNGAVTHCYAVGRDGTLARVEVGTDRFVRADDITPAGVRAGGRVFDTRPAVYYLSDGNAAIVYGSGDTQQLTGPSVANSVFKVVDNAHRRASGGTASTAASCAGAVTSGEFPLPGGHRLVSPPIVRGGVVAWTSFEPDATMPGCNPGRSNIYAMNFESCADAGTGAPRPAPVPGPDGLPSSPEIHLPTGTLLVNSSSGPTGAQTVATTVRVRGAGGKYAKRMYIRNDGDMR